MSEKTLKKINLQLVAGINLLPNLRILIFHFRCDSKMVLR